MSRWNYRLIDHGSYVAIHGVFYRDGKPELYQEKPEELLEYKGSYPEMETPREILAWQLKMMSRALALPALRKEDFEHAA